MKNQPFLFVLCFTAILFRPCCSYAQLGDWRTQNIEESYGHTMYINSLMDKTRKDAASLTLIEKKPGKYKKFKYKIDYSGRVKSKQIPSYLDGMYFVLGECIVNDSAYVRLQTVDTKIVFLIPKNFITHKFLQHCNLPQKIMACINDSLTKYKYIEKNAYDRFFGITEYNEYSKDKYIAIYKPYHQLGDKEYAKFAIENFQLDNASVTVKCEKNKVYFNNPSYNLYELEKLIQCHALLSIEEMDSILQEDSKLLDSAKALFNPKDNIKGGNSSIHSQFKNKLVHLVGQEIIYCDFSDSYKSGDIYTVDSVIPYEHYYDPVRLYISDKSTGKVHILSGNEDDLNKYWSVVKHIEYLRDSLVGKEFVYQYEAGSSYGSPIKQLGTNIKMTEVPTKTVWKCIDVRIQRYTSNPIIVLKNEKYGQGYCYESKNYDGEGPVFGYTMTDKKEYDEKVKAEQKAKQDRYNRLVARFGKSNAKLILEGRIRLGMTREMCKEAWGEPDHINSSVGSWGRHEQWVYEYKYSSNSYLYFENGKLTSWQN